MNKMKIAIVDPVGKIAGMHHYDLGLASGLANNNFDARIYSTFKDSYQSIIPYKFFKSKKSFLIWDMIVYFFMGLFTFVHLKIFKIDYVVLHVFSYTSKDFYPFLLAKIFGSKIISIAHDLEGFEEKDNSYIKNKIYTWSNKIAIHNLYSIKEFNRIFDFKFENKVFQIPHGNYVPFISKRKSLVTFDFLDNLDKSNKYILFFGQIKPTKGLKVLLNSLTSIDSSIHLIIAGRSRYDDFDQYSNIIKNANINDRVHILIRYISDNEREILFNFSDAIILPYTKIYQSGVLILAMSYGIPVIASDLLANQEVIEDGKNGILFKSQDSFDLANKVNSLFTDENIIEHISHDSLKYVLKKHSWDQVGSAFKSNLY
ncbi:glycosyltransferase family 4 protein [Algoriphagus halophytocola]|uniref:Glycosyltransferase family 4 protein n=1 Tax=Algoriphagus halophytocola TaxID=2991499 RepID=A0ABY6MNU2_9BACT|nr:glycosyltransferase family 4 protein [Algoriphagus sp. TR-M5]UZD23874.1 glycosyltransferase family 4 protein [Algoriphagus sp. TR-M5]